jgi:anti-sigma B factor antagonist
VHDTSSGEEEYMESPSYGIRQRDGVIIFDITGDVTNHDNLDVIARAIEERITAENRFVLLNLTKVERVQSAILSIIVTAYKVTNKKHGHLALLGTPDRARVLMEKSHMAPHFSFFEDEDQAIAALMRQEPSSLKEE